MTLLQLVRQEVQQLSDSLDNLKDEDSSICATLDLLKSEFNKAIVTIEEKQANLEVTWKVLKQRQESLEVKTNSMQQDLKTALKSLPPHSEDFSDIVFDAPEQTKWFTEREKEIELSLIHI